MSEQTETERKVLTAQEEKHFLSCESKKIYLLLMCSAGMMGAYTFNLRGGVFCNAQTANFVLMAIAFGKGQLKNGFYYLIPITAYFLGAFLSEALPSPVKKLGFLRWDTYLIGMESLVLLGIGFIPLSMPDQIVQVAINFIASMQYNTFRQAEGVPMSTTFCTNHLRQIGIAAAKVLRKKDRKALHRGAIHIRMIFSFFAGAVLLTVLSGPFLEKAIWLALIPDGVIFVRLVYADLFLEREMLDAKPSGH